MNTTFKGSDNYVASEELMRSVNIAIALQKPLLIKGEPGTGKTMLAEAISKALGTGISGDVTFHSMRITHRETGAPVVEFADPLKTRLETEGVTVHVSITDEKSVVAAFAVAEKN